MYTQIYSYFVEISHGGLVHAHGGTVPVGEWLEGLGKVGWELVAVSTLERDRERLYLKRPVGRGITVSEKQDGVSGGQDRAFSSC